MYIHQPWEDRLPGVNAWFSTEFNRHNTWFEQGREWINYYRRCHFLLQQGKHVADIAYFIGEDTPKMTGVRQPPLPPGYDFDYLNAEVILERSQSPQSSLRSSRRDVLPAPGSPQLDTMRPELLRKIRDLVADGGAILGAPPARSPSLQNHPQCDQRVRELAAELWAGCDGVSSGKPASAKAGSSATRNCRRRWPRSGFRGFFGRRPQTNSVDAPLDRRGRDLLCLQPE